MSRPAAVRSERQAEFTRDWNAGVLLRVMAERFDCSLPCVSATAIRFGLAARRPGHRLPVEDYALVGGEWTPNPRGVLVWSAA